MKPCTKMAQTTTKESKLPVNKNMAKYNKNNKENY